MAQTSISKYLIGIDGGATKTICTVADLNGNIIGKGSAGPSNYHNIGVEEASKAILSACEDAFRKAGLKPYKASIACLGLAGIDSPYDLKVAQNMVDSIDLAEKCIVVNDSITALFGATLGEPGVVVISGTGSVAAGINRVGEVKRAGGWGRIIDDKGSGYDIGRRCLLALLRSFDGREAKTSLTEAVLRRLKLESVEDLVPRVYVKGMDVDEVADLAKIVASEAEKGDYIAKRILEEAAGELALLVIALARRLKMEDEVVEVAVSGGVFKAGRLILDPFEQRLRMDLDKFRIIRPRFTPDIGAVVLAMKEAGLKIDADRLRCTSSTF